MSLFKTSKSNHPIPATPVLLFYDLRRHPEVKFPWGHQEKLLDQYHQEHRATKHIALELPTGSGKTLVGLLIAEYRRRTNRERVVYLCPTRQLCSQVKAHADRYGIVCSLLTGRKTEFDPGSFSDYQRGKAIAITTYSGLFNTHPAFDEPNVILCDDAHAAENYVASMWSLLVNRNQHADFYQALLDFFGDDIPLDIRRRLGGEAHESSDRRRVDLIPAPRYADRIGPLGDLLSAHCTDKRLRTDASHLFSYMTLEGQLESCNIYLSPHEFQIRPVIAPTLTHPPFKGANQRIFMSATLGAGGDLERIFGIPRINRLPLPSGWETRNTGRRLMLFADYLDENDKTTILDNFTLSDQRCLVLVKESRLADKLAEDLAASTTVVRAQEIEGDLSPFTSCQTGAALVLANRYDGIDLPGEACRRTVLVGLPAAANLQERFLLERLGAFSQMRDRIRTRITQGVGRCTRDENDYAAVLCVGEDLLKWCSNETNLQGLNPELQAEITFGLDNCRDWSVDNFQSAIEIFLSRSDEWADAEEDIIQRRDGRSKEEDRITKTLEHSSRLEVDFTYALWSHEYERAYEKACQVTESLSGGSELRPYRAFWHYLACVAADQAWRHTKAASWLDNFRDHAAHAAASVIGIQWLGRLRDAHPGMAPVEVPPAAVNADVIFNLLEEWQIVGRKFEKQLNEVRNNLAAKEAPKFEQGLKVLGEMLGCKTYSWNTAGAPDGLWVLGNEHAVVFEAKSDEEAKHPIHFDRVRQAVIHEKWVRSQGIIPDSMAIYTVMATPRTSIREEAQQIAGDTRYMHVDQLQELCSRAAEVLNTLRARARSVPEEALRELIDASYFEGKLDHGSVLVALLQKRLAELPIRQ